MAAKLFSLLLMILSLGQTAVEAYVNEASLGGNLFLVNRDYAISADYVPNDLVKPNVLGGNESTMLRAEAARVLFLAGAAVSFLAVFFRVISAPRKS